VEKHDDGQSFIFERALLAAPQARQVADRFHLLQNLRETIETQLSRADRSTGRALLQEANDEDVTMIADGPGGRREVAEHRHLSRQAHRRSRQAVFDQSILCAVLEPLSATSSDKPGPVRAASRNG
jgi:hypothetical protein